MALEDIDNAIREAWPLTSADSGTGVLPAAGVLASWTHPGRLTAQHCCR